jgi:hypothetical protein
MTALRSYVSGGTAGSAVWTSPNADAHEGRPRRGNPGPHPYPPTARNDPPRRPGRAAGQRGSRHLR